MKNNAINKIMKTTLAATAVAIALSGCSASLNDEMPVNPKLTTEPASIEYVRSVEGIKEYKLSNGMKVLLYPDQAQSKVIVNITYRVGSVHEQYGETGMAHLLEHMLFKGSTNYTAIDTEFNKRGMRANATTWLDRTNYYESFESTPENLEWALGMEADRMVNATFTKEQLDSEMTVVRNEMERGENSPSRILSARMDSTAFLWHNYANSTIGARSDVENFPFEVLREFYDKHYRPDNAVLTVAGRFDEQQILDVVKREFGRLAKPDTPIQPLYTKEPVQDGERVVTLRRTGEVPIVAVQYHVPSALHSDTPALSVLEQILSDGARGRMQKTLVEPGLSSSAYAWSFPRKDPSGMQFFANGFKGKDAAELEAELINLIENIGSNKITEQEVELAKASILKEREDALRDVVSVGSQLTEYIAMGDYRFIFYMRDLIEQVTVEDVQRVAEKYLIQSNRTLGRFIPTEAPKRATIEDDETVETALETYTGREVVEAGEVYDNTVDNILARLETFQWQQGAKVSVYPKKLRAGEIHLRMTLPTGSAKSLKGYEAEFGLLGGLMYSGTEKYSKEEIASKLDELKASVHISTGTIGEVAVNVTMIKDKMDETLAFVSELLSNPSFEPEEVDIDRKATITNLETKRNEPRDVSVAALRKTFSGYDKGHPKAYRDIDTQIAGLNKVTPKRLKALHKSHMSFNNAHIAVVGDVDAAQMSAKLEATFAHLQGSVDYQEMKPALKEVKDSVNWIETPDKANAQIFIAHRLDINNQHPDYHAALVANAIFGGSGFASRLMQRIRVKEGYSYGTGSGLQLEWDEPHGLYYMYAIAAPENMKNVVAAYEEEVAKAATEGFSEEELKNAIEGRLKALRSSWSNDGTIAGLLAQNTRLQRELQWYTEYQEKLKALTLDEVNAAFNKYIAQEKLNIFAAGDFARVEAK